MPPWTLALLAQIAAAAPPAAGASLAAGPGRQPGPDTTIALPAPRPRLAVANPAAFLRLTGGLADTLARRQDLVEYSDLYGIRAEMHRILSWAMIPLFVGSAYTGFQLRNKGDAAPQWTRDAHGPLAAGTAILFGVNTVTGLWNLVEGRKDPEGRGRRILHGALFLAAGAGFAYVTAAGDNIHASGRANHWHRDVALGSMTVSVVSWSLMAVFR